MFERASVEIAKLKEQFDKEVAAILNHTKVIQVYTAGILEGRRDCLPPDMEPPSKPD